MKKRAFHLPLPELAGLLSSQQRRVLFLDDQGLALKEIAFQLGISISTVKMHRRVASVKLGARSCREGLWRWRQGFIKSVRAATGRELARDRRHPAGV